MFEKGDVALDFCLLNQDGQKVCLRDFRGKWVVLYFYSKDNTPGCTTQAREFSELLDEFSSLNAVVLGVSRDTVESHKKFVEKHGLKITLLSDPEKEVIKAYGVWQKKRRFGRESFGVVRSTFLIDPEGKAVHVWKNVRAKGHASRVLARLKELVAG